MRVVLVSTLALVLLTGCADGATPADRPPEAPSPSPSRPTITPEPSVPSPSKGGRTVQVSGTVTQGVEAGCLLVDGWLLLGGDASVLTAGAQVEVEGQPADGVVTTCQQGRPLRVLSARRTA